MKKTLLNTGLALILVVGLTACGSENGGDEIPPAPIEVGTYSSTTCIGKQVYADSDGVQVDVTCTNPSNIDLDGGAGNSIPYIQINELQVPLPSDKIVSNDGNTIVWHRIVYPLPSGLSTSGVVVVYASDEAGDFEKVESMPFAVQTAEAPTPPPTPTPAPAPTPRNHTPTCESLIVDALGNPTVTTNFASKIHDADGDTLTVRYERSGRLSGTLTIDIANTGILGTDATITISNGDGSAYIDYTVSDGIDRSSICRITFTNLLI